MHPALKVSLAAVPIMLLDLLTKAWLRARLAPGEAPLEVVEGWLHLVHQRNTGVAFGLLRDLPESIRLPLLLGIAAAGVVYLLVVLAPMDEVTVRIACVLVLGGALGNAIDRLVDGAVTDFIVLAYFPYVFNLADVAITAAGALLVLHLFLPARARGERAEEAAA
jgi:signal peptidase II